MMHCVARIIGDVADRKSKLGYRRGPIGTGFLLCIRSETHPSVQWGYIVTAHHVLDDQSKVEVQLSDPFGNGTLYDPIPITDWRQSVPKLDLALAPLLGSRAPVSALEVETNLLNPKAVDVALGGVVHYIGILAPLDRVMVRTGAFGAVHQEGLEHPGGYVYPAHLVDCRSYGGFSGSPCFANLSYAALEPSEPAAHQPPPGHLPPLGRVYHVVVLCGMLTQHLESAVPRDGTLPHYSSLYGVGVMLRANEIWEALMTKEMQEDRRELDKQVEAELSESDPDFQNTGANVPEPDEFERFENLTRKLVNTPKPEKGESEE
jgi:hypothetical protein